MRLHLVDGTFELYRAHYAPRPGHESPRGQDVKATLGLMRSMFALLEDEAEAVTHIAIAFDNPIRSFRNDMFDGYKSDEGVPPELRAQFDGAERAVRALGIRVWSMDRFEADDAIASAAACFAARAEVRILSPDKDFGQCLVHPGVVLVDRIRGRETDRAAFVDKRGYGPASLPDALALTGDSADGIPGIVGFGDKTVRALLERFEHLEQIPSDPALWPKVRGADKLAERLTRSMSEALLYRRLATLSLDAPIDRELEALRFGGVDPVALGEVADALGAPALAGRRAPARSA